MWGKEASIIFAEFEGTGTMAGRSKRQEHEAAKKSLKKTEMNEATQLCSIFCIQSGTAAYWVASSTVRVALCTSVNLT